MGNIIQKSFLAIQLILSRSLSHWKLYFTVVVGVLLSSMIMAGTVLYFDALKEISLQHTFEGYGKNELNKVKLNIKSGFFKSLKNKFRIT